MKDDQGLRRRVEAILGVGPGGKLNFAYSDGYAASAANSVYGTRRYEAMVDTVQKEHVNQGRRSSD